MTSLITEYPMDHAIQPSLDPGDRARIGRLLDRASLAHLALAAVVVVVLLLRPTWPPAGAAGAVLMWAAAGILLGSLAWTTPEERPAWRLVAAAVGAAAVGRMLAVSGWVAGWAPDRLATIEGLSLVVLHLLLVAGVLLLPTLEHPGSADLRVLLDAMMGTVAASVLTWELGLHRSSGAEGALASLRPVLGLLLLAAVLLVLLRPSRHRSDRSLAAAALGAVALLASDLVIPGLGPAGSATGEPLLVAAVASVPSAAWWVRRPAPVRSHPPVELSLWRQAVPFSAVVVMLAAFLWRMLQLSGSVLGVVLPLGVFAAGVLLVARQLVAHRENREAVARERDQLIDAVSRDLRGPLTAVAGFSEVLASSSQDLPAEERDEMLEILRSQSATLVEEVEDLSSLVRGELDRVPLTLARIDGRKAIAEAVVRVFDVDSEPAPVRARVEPYLEVIADRERLVQILAHMLSNAQRYGGGRILVVARRTDDGRRFEVHDDGPGVGPRHEQLVWERFQRGPNRSNDAVPGSGLGLTIVQALARAHGGKAGYRRSDLLGGACFFVELPYDPRLRVERDV